MKKIKVLAIILGISLSVVSLSIETSARSIGSTIGGIIDCPLSGKPCSSDADSSQKERCKISVGVSLTPRWSLPSASCSE
ncbi:hypothetical protein MM213_18290 [Belliella sp. R4-6]|uniref:Uncharacterized protein n=1 Tax=Belliella alkalica TaxID=1730871 RepID=A0ABS9VG81_9BACT|nr:hypothetical protein [Belliella alkalica]MCH7415456.1 hypothetical protein [Belliella alkalica]